MNRQSGTRQWGRGRVAIQVDDTGTVRLLRKAGVSDGDRWDLTPASAWTVIARLAGDDARHQLDDLIAIATAARDALGPPDTPAPPAGPVEVAVTAGPAVTVTPGQLDDAFVTAGKRGHCHTIALALADATGWTLVGAFEPEWGIGTTPTLLRHVAVQSDSGVIVDVDGASHPLDWAEANADGHLDRCRALTDDEIETLRAGLYGLGGLEPIIDSFVGPLLARYEATEPLAWSDDIQHLT